MHVPKDRKEKSEGVYVLEGIFIVLWTVGG